MSKKVKRRKFNFKRFTIFILFVLIFIFGLVYILTIRVKHILIKGTHYLSDEEIIETAKLEDYPSYIKYNRFIAIKSLKKNDLIKDIKIKKRLGFIIEIDVIENKILFIDRTTNKYILSNFEEKEFKKKYVAPVLINYVPENIKECLIKNFSEINYDVLNKISEIEYSPTNYDDERFILYMNDGIEVYITLKKMDKIKKYIEIKEELEGKKGILYLDSGNYLEIKED